MLNIIIIEDERPARDGLMNSLARIGADVNLLASLVSVKDGIEYLSASPDADIIFSDVQLPDGLSFEIFRHCQVQTPVIFITAFDEFMMNAFEYNGIDYLLKPVDERELAKALQKFQNLKEHFTAKANGLTRLVNYLDVKKKTRLIVKRGLENIALPMENIVLFYTENKVVYVIDSSGKKYLCDKNLGELEAELDTDCFFRANRQYIISINYIRGFRSFEKVKLQVDLGNTELNHSIIVSQETAPAFRKWMYEA